MMPAFLHSLFSVTISYLSCMCTAFPFAGTNSQRQGWVRGASEQPFAQRGLSASSAGLSACSGNLLIFLSGCAAYRLLFKQTRALRSNSVFKAIALLAKPAKICQRSAGTSGQTCTLISEGYQSVQIGCSTLLAMSFVEKCARQKNICTFMDFCLYVSGYYLLNSYVFSKSASFAKM